MRRAVKATVLTILLMSGGAGAQTQLRTPDVIFVPTPPEVVDAMLKVAKVGAGDVLYDLGCGDGRIVIAASKLGAKATGIDIDPQRIKEANENAKKEGVADKVTFKNEDLFTANFSDATVVTLYLLPSLNLKLMPKLKALKPGTRIVSHAFDMGDWKPEQTLDVNGRTVYFWTIPKQQSPGLYKPNDVPPIRGVGGTSWITQPSRCSKPVNWPASRRRRCSSGSPPAGLSSCEAAAVRC